MALVILAIVIGGILVSVAIAVDVESYSGDDFNVKILEEYKEEIKQDVGIL